MAGRHASGSTSSVGPAVAVSLWFITCLFGVTVLLGYLIGST